VTRPLILVTNDDGVLAPGLQVLADALADLGDVIVCAPETERSGSAHSISFHTHLRAGSVRAGWWYLSGTPVDCVYFALLHLCERPPAIVCSGINAGFNLGSDVLYSGTVGGAAEGYLRACSGIAVSAERAPAGPLWAAPVVHALAQRILTTGEHVLLNVNVPALPGHVDVEDPARVAELARGRELVVTRLGERRYRDGVQPRTDPMGRPYYWIGGPPEAGSTDLEHDTGAVAAGLVSVTPLVLDLTAPDLGPTRGLVAGLARPSDPGPRTESRPREE
jgi:5'-nucleotidase